MYVYISIHPNPAFRHAISIGLGRVMGNGGAETRKVGRCCFTTGPSHCATVMPGGWCPPERLNGWLWEVTKLLEITINNKHYISTTKLFTIFLSDKWYNIYIVPKYPITTLAPNQIPSGMILQGHIVLLEATIKWWLDWSNLERMRNQAMTRFDIVMNHIVHYIYN